MSRYPVEQQAPAAREYMNSLFDLTSGIADAIRADIIAALSSEDIAHEMQREILSGIARVYSRRARAVLRRAL